MFFTCRQHQYLQNWSSFKYFQHFLSNWFHICVPQPGSVSYHNIWHFSFVFVPYLWGKLLSEEKNAALLVKRRSILQAYMFYMIFLMQTIICCHVDGLGLKNSVICAQNWSMHHIWKVMGATFNLFIEKYYIFYW